MRTLHDYGVHLRTETTDKARRLNVRVWEPRPRKTGQTTLVSTLQSGNGVSDPKLAKKRHET
jgi:hypothetical protein